MLELRGRRSAKSTEFDGDGARSEKSCFGTEQGQLLENEMPDADMRCLLRMGTDLNYHSAM